VVQQLAAAGAEANVWDGKETPLHHAAATGCPALVAALLQAGADPAGTIQVNPNGHPVIILVQCNMLHVAASSGSLEVVQQVLGALGSSRAASMMHELGKVGNCQPYSTPLHLAAAGGSLEVVEALVAAGADLEQQDADGLTPLHRALSLGHYHVVPLLVTPGNASMRWRSGPDDPGGDTPLLHAARYQYNRYYKQERQLLATAAAKAVTALLAAGADPHAGNRRGSTPLTAAAKGIPEVLQVLLKHELQRLRQQQQQQSQPQQQQQGVDIQLSLALLQKLGARALRAGNGPTWSLLVNWAAQGGGREEVCKLWSGVKQRLQPGTAAPEAGSQVQSHATAVLEAWVGCWMAACKDLAAQRDKITDRLEQLVIRPYQQQQQDGCAEASRPRLTRELRWLLQGQPAPAFMTSTAAAGGDSGSSRATPASTRRSTGVASQMSVLEAAAARGSEEAVLAALGQLPDRATALAAAAAAAGSGRHLGMCVQLLRELVMLDEAKGREEFRTVLEEPSRWPEQQYWQLQVCDALLADWLALQQLRVQGLQGAVLAAAKAASVSACRRHVIRM
jgi:ankyrin repeat protein